MGRKDRLLFGGGAALILGYFFLLVRPSLRCFFSRDDLMNLHRSWTLPAALLVKANLLFFWASPFYRPLPSVWYRVLYDVAGFRAFPFHAAYLLIFAINLWLSYSVALRLSGSREIAGVATLLGSYHYNMAVLYLDTAYIYDALCYCFFFAALLLYVRTRQERRRLPAWGIVASGLLDICALNSKEMAVTLPAFLLLYELVYHASEYRGSGATVWEMLQRLQCVILTGIITLCFAAGRALGENSLLTIREYRPVFTWARLLETSRHYFGAIFADGHDWPVGAVLALWGILPLAAWAMRSRVLTFAWLFLALGSIPVAFVSPRAPAQYAIPWFGLVLYGAVILVTAMRFLSAWLPPDRAWMRGASLLVGLAALLYPYYRHKGIGSASSVVFDAPIDRAAMEQLHGLQPHLRSGSHLFFMGEAPPTPWVCLFFLTRLSYGDKSIELERPRDLGHEPADADLARYDHVFDYEAGRFYELQRPWPRARQLSTTPTIAWGPLGAEVYHADWLPVSSDAPARPGELLITKTLSLGPTDPPTAPGVPFPSSPFRPVVGKIFVTVDGLPADIVTQIGWPEKVNTYRLDFRVPKGTRDGIATVQIAVGGVTGPPVTVPVR